MTSVRPSFLRQLVGEVRVVQVADRQRDAERRQDPPEDDVVGQLDHAEAQPREHDHVEDDVREQPEEAVPVPGHPPPYRRCAVRHGSPLGDCCRYALPSACQKPPRVAHPAEDAALRLDHRERRRLELREVGADAVLEHQAVVAAVVRLAHRGVDAHLGRDAAHDELPDAAVVQHRVEVGGVEGALAGLVDDRLAGRGLELVDDVVAVLAAHEDAAHRPGIADAGLEAAAQLLRLAAGRRGRGGGPRACG